MCLYDLKERDGDENPCFQTAYSLVRVGMFWFCILHMPESNIKTQGSGLKWGLDQEHYTQSRMT